MQFTWSAPDQVDLPFLVGKRQVVGNFLARRAKKFFGGVNLRCRKDFACFLGKKCRICPSFQEEMQDLQLIFWPEGRKNFLGVNMRFRKDFAVGKEIRTSRKISKERYKHITPAERAAESDTLDSFIKLKKKRIYLQVSLKTSWYLLQRRIGETSWFNCCTGN